LVELYVKAQTPPTLELYAFFGVPATIPVHVPSGTADAYKRTNWNYFSNYVDDLPSVNITVKSNDPTMGTAAVTRENTLADNTATFAATADEGYHFIQWNDGNTDNPRTVAVTENITFIAEFAANIYPVTVGVNNAAMGTVTGAGDYPYNTEATLAATVNEGYSFVQWNDGNTDNPRTVTVTGDMTFTAEFAAGTGITETTATAIAVYPNPVRDVLHVQSLEAVEQVSICDISGKILKQTAAPDREVRVSDLEAGVYLVKIKTAAGEVTRKIMKE
jgi:hypothetical protein